MDLKSSLRKAFFALSAQWQMNTKILIASGMGS